MKKILFTILVAISLIANAQTDISVSAILPADGYEYNTTDTNVFLFRVTNEGTTPLITTDTVFYRMHIDNTVLIGTPTTFYGALRPIDPATNMQSVLAPDSSFTFRFGFLPFSQTLVDIFTNHIVCYDVILSSDGELITENDMTNNTFCTEGINNVVGVTEVDNYVYSTYPNPVVNELNIDFTAKKGLVTIFEMTGRKINSVNVSEGINTIDVSGLDKGNYMFIITNEDSHLGTGKFQK